MRAIVVAIVVAVLGAGCSKRGEPAEADQTYTVRGAVERMPTPSDHHMYVRHEAIPDFVHEDGVARGMDSMSMPFDIGEGVSTDGVTVGTKVTMTFEVRWKSSHRLRITAIEALPADTELQFERSAPPR
jgi:hypothetical protein